MKMYPKTWKFYTVVYSLAIIWCCVINVNGDTNTDIDPTMMTYNDPITDLVKIISGVQNERSVKPSNSILSVNMNAGSINFNIPLGFSSSNPKKIEQKTPEKPIDQVRDDYTLTEGIGYHKLHKTKLNWNDARKACMAQNAHLAVINSAEEEGMLRRLIIENVDEEYQVYIGAHDIFEENDWVTVDGESLDKVGYNKWAPGEPNDDEGEEDCAVLHKYRGMNDVPCYLAYYYICEIPL